MPKKMTKITTSELILSAIFYLQQKNGVTAKDITKYICEKRGCAQKHMKENVKKALDKATVKGVFCRNRGLYRITNGFGVNKLLNSKNKGRGKKQNLNKGTKPKENASNEKTDFQVRFLVGKISEPLSLNQIVDQRMNDVHDSRNFYVDLPASGDQEEDDDDDDFDDTEEDDDENDFFSDDMDENGKKTEAKTIFINEKVNSNSNSLQGSGEWKLYNDPFRRGSGEYLEKELSEERLQDIEGEGKGCSVEEIREIQGTEGGQMRENSKESSENPSEGNQFGDDYHNMEEFDNQQQVEMDWDCQPNDLERMDRLLENENYTMNVDEREQVGSDTAWDNSKGMKLEKSTSRVELSIKDDPTDSLEASHMAESTR